MATLTLTFDLPEEQLDAQVAQDGWKWRLVVTGVDNQCRAAVKYGQQDGRELPQAAQDAYRQVRKWILEECESQGVTIYD